MIPFQYDYLNFLKLLESFADNHQMIKRFSTDFDEQFNQKCTIDNIYPFMYVAPRQGTAGVNTSTYTFRVYVVDQLQKDRSNVGYILNDTSFILGNLRILLGETNDEIPVTLINTPVVVPLNNFGVDFLAGHYADFEIEYDSAGLCDIPFTVYPTVSGTTC